MEREIRLIWVLELRRTFEQATHWVWVTRNEKYDVMTCQLDGTRVMSSVCAVESRATGR